MKRTAQAVVRRTLAQRSLRLPRIEPVDWVVGQRFTSNDDPDRTDPSKYAWEGPAFLKHTHPASQRQLTSLDELDVRGAGVRGCNAGFSFARVVHNALNEDQCAELLDQVNAKGFTPALLNIGGGVQVLASDVRDGLRVIVDSQPLTQYLFEILQPHLPQTVEKAGKRRQLVGLNERCRFLCYTPGHVFEPHFDGRFWRTPPHPNAGDCSLVTLQLYLNNVPPENGGATSFLGRPENKMEPKKISLQPRAGSVLLFTQDLRHEGSEVKAGVKYTMRTEAMYRQIGVEEAKG